MNVIKPDAKNNDPNGSGSNASFLNNAQANSAKTASNLIEIPSITLPKGGGAIKSIDEKFSVNAVNGTAGFSIPLPFSIGRSGFTPSVSLSYNSGNGNSVFGLGWTADTPAIQRKTDKKLPLYKDMQESDTFVFSGAEDLVLVSRDTDEISGKIISRFQPRIEGGFARIERIEDEGNIYWKVTSGDNIVSVFGQSENSKLYDPVKNMENRIFKWSLEYTYDNKGNFARYIYKKENLENVVQTPNEKNRFNGLAAFTNMYLKNIRYGNSKAFYEGEQFPEDFLFEMVFDYEEHDEEKPTCVEVSKWSARQDAFSDYKPGFIEPVLLLPTLQQQGRYSQFSVKVDPQQLPATLEAIQKAYASYFPGNVFDYHFLDEKFNRQYSNDYLFGKVFGLLAALAILIASLGLAGLSLLTSAQRTKEIGIRKVLGASVTGIVLLLTKDFIKLVLLALIIASPVAWYMMHLWLQDFAYRVDISWWIFSSAGLLSLVIALLVISFQTVRSAIASPVKSLRIE